MRSYMRFKTLAAALVALVVLAGYVSTASCQYYDLCQESPQPHGGSESSREQGNGSASDGCQCLCHFLSLLSIDPTLAIDRAFDGPASEYQAREDRLVPGPVARIDHPPQLG